MQTATVGTYEITIYREETGLWSFWIKQEGRLLVRSIGTADCEETKLLLLQHLHSVVMNRKEKKHFDPDRPLEWKNYLVGADGTAETAG